MQAVPAGSLLEYLQQLSDPRGRQGRRHDFVAMLATIVCAFLQGARGFSAIAQWIHSQEVHFWHELGYTRKPPKLSAFRKLLLRLPAAEFEHAIKRVDSTLPWRADHRSDPSSRWPSTAKRCVALCNSISGPSTCPLGAGPGEATGLHPRRKERRWMRQTNEFKIMALHQREVKPAAGLEVLRGHVWWLHRRRHAFCQRELSLPHQLDKVLDQGGDYPRTSAVVAEGTISRP